MSEAEKKEEQGQLLIVEAVKDCNIDSHPKTITKVFLFAKEKPKCPPTPPPLFLSFLPSLPHFPYLFVSGINSTSREGKKLHLVFLGLQMFIYIYIYTHYIIQYKRTTSTKIAFAFGG